MRGLFSLQITTEVLFNGGKYFAVEYIAMVVMILD